MASETPSPSENTSSVTKKITRSLEAIRMVLQSDLGELRSSIAGILKKKGMEMEVPSSEPRPVDLHEPAFVKPTEKNPGMLDFRASKREETRRTPRQVRDLVPISEDARKEDKALSEAFTEVFRRMSELVFVPNTNPIYAFLSHMFLHIRVRSDDLQAEKTFDQIFDEQIRWYCEEHFLSRRRVFSPALSFHWDCYFQSPEAERYEDNLVDHENPEIRLYGILMRSCVRMFDRYMKNIFPQPVSPESSRPLSRILLTDADQAEGEKFRGKMMDLKRDRSPCLLLEYSLADYFEENLPKDIKAGLEAALPPGLDGVYLFDTNLFVSALLEKEGNRKTKSLGTILNAHSIDEICAAQAGIPGFFHFPTDENHPERISTRDVAVKNTVFWKRMGDKAFYDSLAQGTPPDETRSFDYDVALMETTDFKYLAYRVVQAFQNASNIYEVLNSLFPDLEQRIFNDGDAISFVSTRFEKLAVAARTLLQGEKEWMEVVVGFFGILSQSDFSIWNKNQPRLRNRSPFQYLKAKAQKALENKPESAWEKEKVVYESHWNFLNQSSDKAWDHRSESYYSRISRLSGWRMGQRNVRLKMIADLLQKMGWNFRDHVLDAQGDDWCFTLEQKRTEGETKRQLTLPFMTPQGKVLVCRFPELQR